MSSFEPKPFGKYYLTDCIAIGGMAEIYKAKTFGVDGFEKILAIKKILSHYSADKDFITMLTDEAKLVVNLSHANIVQVYDLGRVADDYFISMEFIDGIDLREMLERSKEIGKPIPADICVYILSEVCRGLDYAHNKKDANGESLQIVHRDISPQNILVSYEGGVKIVDFGIAKAAMNLSQTNIGTLKGKVTYMAPEQAFGKPIDGRTDLYSAGIVLYELLTLERLFTGESQMEVLKKIRNTRITAENINPKVPQNLRAILAKALAYNVKDRYQSASDMQIDLARALYSHYSEFTPRKLVEFLKVWFLNKNIKTDNEPDKNPNKETILVSSSTEQSGSVLREETRNISASNLNLQDTLKPEDNIDKKQFGSSSPPEEHTEKTEKSNHTGLSNEELSLSELLRRKQSAALWRKIMWILAITALVAALWFGRGMIFTTEPNQPKKTGNNTIQPMKVLKRSVTISTTPTDANLVWDGIRLNGTSPFTIENIELNSSHKIKISKDGFAEFSDILKVTNQTPTTLTFTLAAAKYALQVNSKPDGAEIFIDGTSTGLRTPSQIDTLKPNQNHKIRLSLAGHKPFETDITGSSADSQEINAQLEELPKTSLAITSQPSGAQIWLNGKDTGLTTPHTYEDFKDDQAKITLKLKDHDESSMQLDIRSNDTNSWHGKLVKTPVPEPVVAQSANLRITSNVAGAEVKINGIRKGTTPLTVNLPIGSHQIFVSKADHTTASKSITLKPNQKPPELYFKINPKKIPAPNTTTAKPVETKATPTPPPTKETTTNVSATGQLRIDSNPRGASVKINGAAKGVTPIVVSALPKNTPLSVTVSKSGYKSWSTSVTLSRDKTEIKANLSP